MHRSPVGGQERHRAHLLGDRWTGRPWTDPTGRNCSHEQAAPGLGLGPPSPFEFTRIAQHGECASIIRQTHRGQDCTQRDKKKRAEEAPDFRPRPFSKMPPPPKQPSFCANLPGGDLAIAAASTQRPVDKSQRFALRSRTSAPSSVSPASRCSPALCADPNLSPGTRQVLQ